MNYAIEKETRLNQLVDKVKEISISTDRDNANVGNNFSAKLLQSASAANKTINIMEIIPDKFVKAYEEGLIHIHDLDSYTIAPNCLAIDTGKMLSRGFNTGYGTINPPKRLESAAELSCILLQSCQNDLFGGQAHQDYDNDMAKWVELSEKEIWNDTQDSLAKMGIKEVDPYKLYDVVQEKLDKLLHQSQQQVVYNLNSMHSRAGSQVPFSSVNLGVPKTKYAAMICEAFLDEYEKGLGKGEQPIFPSVIFRVKAGVNRDPGDPYYYLFQKACKVLTKRMNPTFLNLDAPYNLKYYNMGLMPSAMGCRTNVVDDVNGEPCYKGRGNNAPVSMNLVKLAIESVINATGNDDVIYSFFEKLDDTLKLAEEQLLHRHSILCKLKGKDLPFVALEGCLVGSEEVGPEDSIEPILKHGTYSIGFIGIAEVCKLLVGKHHGESDEAHKLALSIVEYIRKYCDEATQRNKLNFTCYATPKFMWAVI